MMVTSRRSRSGTGHPGRHDAVMRAAVAASIALTAPAKPGGSTEGAVVVDDTGARAVLVVDGGAAVALVVDSGGAVVVVAEVAGAKVVSDSTPRAAEGGGVREA
ncbi:MAG TPA: hypothetical protein VFF24_07955, partial [Acidimicrobiia bacterium]|nr:hypothetical protein [Acidimicrobiia bacterium]